MVVALNLRRHTRQLPLESHPTSFGIGVRGESHRVSAILLATNPGCRDSCGIVGSRCLPVVIWWIRPPEWTKGEPSGVTTAKRQPAVSELLVAALTNEEPGSYLVAAADARRTLLEAGFHVPSWRDFVSDHPPRPGHNNMDDGEPGPRQGWQVVSSMSLEEQFVSSSLWPRLTLQSRVLFRSQGGPMARPITAGSIHSRSVCFFCACLPVWPATRFSCPWRGFWDVGGSRWRVQPHGFAVRQGAECRSTSVCRTWIWPIQTRLTTAVWRLWLMGSPCFKEHSWPCTPRSCQF